MKNKLIIFTRYPEAGRAKTRLIPALGPEGAAALQRRMTEQIVRTAMLLEEEIPVECEIYFADGSITKMKDWLGNNINFRPQGHGDLGEKLDRAFDDSFRDGYQNVIIIGSDCPTISTTILATAIKKLADSDLVLGPATDGGYYLIGLSSLCSHLFQNLPWGSSTMLQETLVIAERSDLSVFLLEELSDVDRKEDLSPKLLQSIKNDR